MSEIRPIDPAVLDELRSRMRRASVDGDRPPEAPASEERAGPPDPPVEPDGSGGPSPGDVAESGPPDRAADPDTARRIQQAVSFVLRSTRQRPQTRAELDAKLTRREHPREIRRAALDRAEQIGAVDDAAFARAWIEDRGEQRGYGRARLERELAGRGVPEVVAQDALAALDDRDELAVATQVARSRIARLPAHLDERTVARRLVAYLGRRGYPDALARRVAIDVSGLDREWD